jgi:two-component system chemotaxis response regulator CheB
MVVDDSVVLRSAITRIVNDNPAVAQVVASAANGKLAVERAAARDIDVVVLDIEMPVMDGITALPKLLAHDPKLVVIMASTLTQRNAEISFKAMAAGAKDYVPKPSSLTPGAGADDFKRELLEKIKSLGLRYRREHEAPPHRAGAPVSPSVGTRKPTLSAPKVLAVGSSTGGPQALTQFFKSLPKPFRLPVLVTQHMPPTFTGLLAQTLQRETGHICAEATEGEVMLPGRVYIAPGDFHMEVDRKGTESRIHLTQDAKENFCRPAVDPMLRSLVKAFGGHVLVTILTGMGQDGLQGAQGVIAAGGNVIGQDESSSVVWGMPGAVAKAGLCCAVAPPDQLAVRASSMAGA